MISRKLTLFVGLVTSLIFIFSSCKKINDSTAIGGDLIPAVDNITTFETTLDVETFNGIFSLNGENKDSLRITGHETNILGNITNDPLFGTTSAFLFTQLKPSTFRFSFGFSNPDSLIALDSVILVLKYLDTYGDSTSSETANVYEIDQSSDFIYDTAYLVRENHITYSNLLGSATYIPRLLDDSIHLFKDSASHQLRIRLNDEFGHRLLAYDSSSGGGNNAFYSDSVFNKFFKGFAIDPGTTGNALIAIDPSASKLSVYYKYRHGVLDTAVTDFVFTPASASANYVKRDNTGSEAASSLGGSAPDDLVYLQTQPGTFATVKIPGLDTLSNCIVHRAELIVSQAYNDALDATLTPPLYLYLDAHDTTNKVYPAIPFDVLPPDGNTGSLLTNNPNFGFAGKPAVDGPNTIREWKFNISRYVQNVIKGSISPYELRLYAPYIALNTFGASYVNPAMVAGRVRVYGGTPASNPRRMRLRIVYSKI